MKKKTKFRTFQYIAGFSVYCLTMLEALSIHNTGTR